MKEFVLSVSKSSNFDSDSTDTDPSMTKGKAEP
jgi:hypothetical protein